MTGPDGRVLVATDLDRTLIRSARSAGLAAGAEVPLVCVELYRDAMQSFTTAAALDGLREVARRAVLVPATTRTPEQLDRVVLPGVVHRYRVASNGGVLLVDGEPDRDWAATVRDRLVGGGEGCAAVRQLLAGLAGRPWLLRAHEVPELFCYAVVDRALLPAAELDDLTATLAGAGWTVSLQGRKLYLVPRGLTKSAAVTEVARRVGAGTVLAAGDSLLDVPMLAAADAAVRPGDGELADRGWCPPHVTVLAETGVLSAEAVVDWMLVRTAAA